MEDEEKVYTFDVFEELLFAISIMSAKDEVDFRREVGYKKKNPYINRKQATAVVNELMARFGYSDREAKQAANEVMRFDKMLLSDDEDDNLFFWDDDYAFFFEKGFIEGINRLKSYAGEQAGYGYDYTCDIFRDIGLKPPLLLLGTKEANRIANEVSAKRAMEIMNKLGSKLLGTDGQDLHLPDDLRDEDLPFS